MKKISVIASLILLTSAIFAYGYLIYPHSTTLPSGSSLDPPSFEHLLGTDDLGIDIFAQLSRSYFISLFLGISTSLFATSLGGSLGFLSGYLGGRVDQFLLFLIDVFAAVPRLPVMILLGTFIGDSPFNLLLIIGLFSWAPIARLIRNATMIEKEKGYVQYSKRFGASLWHLFHKHLSKVLLPLLIVSGIRVIGLTIVSEASLAFVGLINPTQKSMGIMINRALNFSGIYYTNFWTWWMIPPIVVLVWMTFLLRELSMTVEEASQKG